MELHDSNTIIISMWSPRCKQKRGFLFCFVLFLFFLGISATKEAMSNSFFHSYSSPWIAICISQEKQLKYM